MKSNNGEEMLFRCKTSNEKEKCKVVGRVKLHRGERNNKKRLHKKLNVYRSSTQEGSQRNSKIYIVGTYV